MNDTLTWWDDFILREFYGICECDYSKLNEEQIDCLIEYMIDTTANN